MERIIELELAGLTARAAALGYTLRITPRAKERLATLGYQERYGARALKRTLLLLEFILLIGGVHRVLSLREPFQC